MLIVTLVILTLICIVSIYFCLKFALIIINVEEAIQSSLDILDAKHISITNILQRPLFYDSLEVRQVLRDLEDARTSIHSIALKLTNNFSEESEK